MHCVKKMIYAFPCGKQNFQIRLKIKAPPVLLEVTILRKKVVSINMNILSLGLMPVNTWTGLIKTNV